MFVGEFSHNIDSKGRIIMPVKFREQLGEHFMITKGLDGCLFVYPMDEWERVAEQFSNLPSNQKNARFLQRTFLSGASEAEPDKQGKVLITQPHREHAKLTKEVIIIGVSKRVEIWDAEAWKKYSMPAQEDDEVITAEEAAESMEAISF